MTVSLPSYLEKQAYLYRLEKARSRTGQGTDYTPYGGCADLYDSADTEALISGPAGTGKSRACLQKLHHVLTTYPGARALIVRKTRASLTDSALVTYEDKVLNRDPAYVGNVQRENRHIYRYPNGSEVVVGGLDKPSKVMSTEFDFIYVQEAIELTDTDWEALSTRNRNYVTKVQQLIGDTNPDHPHHWLKQRCEAGRTRYIESHHEDNPVLFVNGNWTVRGLEYIARLDALTGVRKERLRYGRWVQSEGVIFDNFDRRYNVSEEAEYNPAWPVLWGVDDGYVQGDGPGYASYHPRVILFAHVTPHGGVHIFAEQYETLTLPEASIETALATGYAGPDVAYVDSSAAELRSRIWDKGIQTVGATHTVAEGIKNVRRLVGDGEGIHLLKIHPRCIHLIREMSSWVYDPNSTAAIGGEPKPAKIDDHGPSAVRYLTWHLHWSA